MSTKNFWLVYLYGWQWRPGLKGNIITSTLDMMDLRCLRYPGSWIWLLIIHFKSLKINVPNNQLFDNLLETAKQMPQVMLEQIIALFLQS